MKTSSRARPSIVGTIDSLVGAHLKDRAALVRILDLGVAVRATTALIHGLQKERGLSSGYLASEGARFAKALVNQSTACQKDWKAAVEAWDRLPQRSLSAALETALGTAWGGGDELRALRAEVKARVLTPASAVLRFTALVERLLGIVAQAPGTSPHPEVTLALLALFNFAQAKESSGQERALGAAVCAQGHFEPFQHDRFLLVARQRTAALEVFRQHGTRDDVAAWVVLEASGPFRELEELRDLLVRADAGEGVSLPTAEDWFDRATGVIEALRDFEVGLLDSLERLCVRVLAEARSAWENQQEEPTAREVEVLRTLGKAHLKLLESDQDDRIRKTHDQLLRWRRDLGRIEALTRSLMALETKARVLALDARIEAVDRTSVARDAAALHRALGEATKAGADLLGILRLSADRTLEAVEGLELDHWNERNKE